MRLRAIRLSLCLLAVPSAVGASGEALLTVAQPFLGGSSGLYVVRTMTYSTAGNYFDGAHHVALTCEANLVRTPGDGVAPQNRNEAHSAGLRIDLEPSPGTYPPPDTLFVTLNAAGALGKLAAWGEQAVDRRDALLRVTIDCILDNASRGAPPKWVAIRVIGTSALSEFDGVWKPLPADSRREY